MNLLGWFPLGKVPEIAPRELARRRDQFQIVDTRSTAEFRSGHIEGATSLPITHFSHHAVTSLHLDRAKPVVTSCLTAHRSIPATRSLREMGYDASQLAGGMRAWWAANLPTEPPHTRNHLPPTTSHTARPVTTPFRPRYYIPSHNRRITSRRAAAHQRAAWLSS